jgi:hypothetical protein
VKVVAIVGQMRSGTSLLASIVHHLGIPVATVVGAPLPPKWQFDWEDPEFSTKLMHMRSVSHLWFCQYLARRAAATRALWDGSAFGLKSPYLALHWGDFVAACKAENHDLFVLKTMRSQEAIDRSMSHAVAHGVNLDQKHQARIRAELSGIAADMDVSFGNMIERGDEVVREIAGCLGEFSEADIERAAAQIRPQEVATCR